MDDKEVGELWAWLGPQADKKPGMSLPLHWECRQLIRKLVEERRARYDRSLTWACYTFGIDPKEFNS